MSILSTAELADLKALLTEAFPDVPDDVLSDVGLALMPTASLTTMVLQARTETMVDGAVRVRFVAGASVAGVLGVPVQTAADRAAQREYPTTHVFAVDGQATAQPGDRFALGARLFYVEGISEHFGTFVRYELSERLS